MSFPRVLYFSQPARRLFGSTKSARIGSLSPGPAPPRLPRAEQEVYERLQRSSTGAFSSPTPSLSREQESASSERLRSTASSQIDSSSQNEVHSAEQAGVSGITARVQATGEGEELHPDVRRGTQPEFEGDINPKTGEVGGPKNEPLRWGGHVDWSYNGRVTDF